METKPRVVIIGGGFGGLEAAKELANKPVKVTIIDKKNHHTFQPLLYQVGATAVLSPGEIASPIRRILQNYKNIEVVLGRSDWFRFRKTKRKITFQRRNFLRLFNHRGRCEAFLFRTRRMGKTRAGFENHRRCAGNSAARFARL